jgi:hypothetical protein
MAKVEKLEEEVQKLSRAELAAFREWFRQYDSDEWDHQIEEDIKSGRLDKLADEALTAHKAGKSKEI